MDEHQKFYKDVTAKLRKFRNGIGKNINAQRQQQRLPLKKLARLSRLNPDTIDQLELGKGEISLTHIIRLSVALDVGIEKLLSLNNHEER